MKFVHITVHFEFAEQVEDRLDECGVSDYVAYPQASGRDSEGKHDGTQVFPGHFSVFQALVEDETLARLLDVLNRFKQAKHAHEHLRAVALPVETMI